MDQHAGMNIAPAEPVILLELALEAMREYRQKHGSFPTEWHELEISFSGGPTYAYRAGDPGTFPRPGDGNRWKPRNCAYRYIIESATGTTFRIIAVSPEKKVAYEITEKTELPRKLFDPMEAEEGPPERSK